ncbi:MAG TPA: PRC-barrel domain-containing protein, partial [Anaerolineae bacterium]
MNLSSRKKLLLFIPLLILALMLGACEPAEEAPVEEPVVEEPLEEEPLEEEPLEEEPLEEEPILEEEPGVAVDPIMLSSDLVGLDITNDFDDQVAEVSDVLIDAQGMIRFIIFDAGGFLGIGERTTAVDWSLFEVTPQDTGGVTVVFVGGLDELETAPEVDAAVLAEPDLVLDAVQLGLSEELDGLIQVSEFEDFDLLDYNLVNLQGEDLGEIEELVLDLVQGRVTYAIAEIGGFLGLGENSIAIPWGQLQ